MRQPLPCVNHRPMNRYYYNRYLQNDSQRRQACYNTIVAETTCGPSRLIYFNSMLRNSGYISLNSPPQDAVVSQTVYAICSATTIQRFCEVGDGSTVQNCPVFSTSHSIVSIFLPPAMYCAIFETETHLVFVFVTSLLFFFVNALMRGQ